MWCGLLLPRTPPSLCFLQLLSGLGGTALLVIPHLGSLASNLPPPSHQSFDIHTRLLTGKAILVNALLSEVKVAQSCPTLCDPIDCSLPLSCVHGILQARILEWVAFPFSRGSSNPGTEPKSPTLQADFLPSEPPGKPIAWDGAVKSFQQPVFIWPLS